MRFVDKFFFPSFLGFSHMTVDFRAWNLFAAVAGHGSSWSGAQGAGGLFFSFSSREFLPNSFSAPSAVPSSLTLKV